MPHSIRLNQHGGPDVMQWEETPLQNPGPGEARIRQTAVGVNFIDVYQRNGAYPVELPGTIGMEAAGVVEAIGDNVDAVGVGDRVAYVMGPPGSYTESRIYPAERLIPLPEDISDQQAAAMMLKGLTAAYLVGRTFVAQSHHTVLVHAAAGGVGLILCQWLNNIGATVIGTVGGEEKAALAQAYGCKHIIDYSREDFAAKVKDLTNGAGVHVVYDGVGAATFDGSLKSLATFGSMVSFGAASGAPPDVPVKALAPKALYLTRPGLAPHTGDRSLTLDLSSALFEACRAGVKVEINQTWPLAEAADAHRALESRATTGSTILTV